MASANDTYTSGTSEVPHQNEEDPDDSLLDADDEEDEEIEKRSKHRLKQKK